MKVIKGSLLEADVDIIVNAANSHLRHGGGIARAIADAATDGWKTWPPEDRELFDEYTEEQLTQIRNWFREHQEAPLVPTGGAYLTSAGLLPFQAVIHAVGPIWGGGAYFERGLLVSAHKQALYLARHKLGNKGSIGFPAISCGIFRYPVDQAALLATYACQATDLDVSFYVLDDKHYEEFSKAIERVTR